MAKKGIKQTLTHLFSLADVQINGNRPWDIQVHNPKFYQRVLAESDMGLGEAYMDGWWDCKRIDLLIEKILRANLEKRIKNKKSLIWFALKAKLINRQNKSRSLKVAKEHYDLDNKLYEFMLDKNMQYTCGYWRKAKNLEKAQEDKLDLVCRKLQLKKGDKVLELGSGFGGFARYAAKKYGCHVTCYNISKEQVEYARKICKGLPVDIKLADYRNVKGKFDKIASIGLCEHIGRKNYRDFMKLANRCLKPGGLFLLHTIGWGSSQKTSSRSWLDKYIFPGGEIPSVKQLAEAADHLLVMEDWHNFGADYALTLMAWYNNFTKNWDKLKKDYDERFYRMWTFYLLMCAGVFRSRKGQLFQVVLSKGGVKGGYRSVR